MPRRSRACTVTMVALGFVLIAGLTLGLVFGLRSDESERTFTVDYVDNTFRMDGKPFRYVSGSFHYFRALPEVWQDRLRTMRAAGLNVVDTYVEWSLHNPHYGVYNWEGIADLERFIELARYEGLYVILRPGPYICAERDNGGLPHWLFKLYPGIRLRTYSGDYEMQVRTWYSQLMPRMQRFLYGNGGPIIMVQVENEYGAFHACDHNYTRWLRDETEEYVNQKALLFTTDIPNDRIQCGKIEGVFATTDFGIDRIHEIDDIWKTLRTIQPNGPLVNSEFYPGWLTHWQEENQRRDGNKVAESLRKILEYGASVNIYMFFGGTNFGFTAGANDWGYGNYTPDITSYDYDAVMDEAGGITEKYELVRKVIAEFMEVPQVSVPTPPRRIAYGQVEMTPITTLLSEVGRSTLSKGAPVEAERPQSFEELDLYSGLVLYETTMPKLEIDPTLLSVEALRDRAFVYVDERYVSTLSRENAIYSTPLNNGMGSKLQLLVENQGRINFNVANDTKGIFGDISVQKLSGEKQKLTKWISTAYPLDGAQMELLVEKFKKGEVNEVVKGTDASVLAYGPVVYYGEFNIAGELGDTYLNTLGWGKGVAYLNGLNLGRYWPLAGPQLTMYVPKAALREGQNTLVLVEYQRANKQETSRRAMAQFDDTPQLDG